MGFLSEHILLILTVAGAAASFLATLLGLVSEKRPVMILALLAGVGFVVGIAYQLEVARRNEAGAQIKAAAEAAQTKTLQAIDRRVTETQVTAEAIAHRLKARSWAEVGSELVTIQASGVGGFDETMAFAKGPPDEWRRFAGWLEQVSRTEVTASLSLTLRPGTRYDSGLLLAYLLTGPATRAALQALFPMLETSVFPARDPAQLVRSMIEQQLSVAVTTVGSKPYLARLERMVRLATR
ncbi:MAG: hypothetical protein NDI82_10245 [Anaeromyxobacteraceae bacterium]|nr:hypothetical protein [Anaeromyxobacteraceae bacterium]